jgi:uncharacterized membrane protein YesL
MGVEQSIQPINVAAATLFIQLIFIALVAATSALTKVTEEEYHRNYIFMSRYMNLNNFRKTPTLLVALVTIAILLISDDLYSVWSPMFSGVGINTIPTEKAIGIVFIMDLGLTGWLMYATGGSRDSPFTPAIFTLPALAIFLRLPTSMFLTYAAITAVIYVFLHIFPRYNNISLSKISVIFMSISCLFLSMLTGYITRPLPISDLHKRIHSNVNIEINKNEINAIKK